MPRLRLRVWTALASGGLLAFAWACGLDVVGAGSPDAPREGGASLPESGKPSGEASAPAGEVTCNAIAIAIDAPWPMVSGCVTRRGRTVLRGPRAKPALVWDARVPTTALTMITIGMANGQDLVTVPGHDEGVVLFGPDGGRQALFDGGVGQDNNVSMAPTHGVTGTFYFGSGRRIVAQSATEIRYRYDTANEVDTSPLVDDDGTAYAGSLSHHLFAILPDGGKRWEVDLNGEVRSAAALTPTGTILVGSRDDYLRAFDRNGSRLWEFHARADVDAPPVVAEDGTIYIGTSATKLHALTPDGQEKWVVTAGPFDSTMTAALGWDGTVYGPHGPSVVAFNPDGTLRWRAPLAKNARTGVIVDPSGTLFVGAQGNLYAIGPDGKIVWELEIADDPVGLAIGHDETLYVTTTGNHVRAYR